MCFFLKEQGNRGREKSIGYRVDRTAHKCYYIHMIEGKVGNLNRRDSLKILGASIVLAQRTLFQPGKVESAPLKSEDFFDVTQPIGWPWVRTDYPTPLPGMSDGAEYRITENIPANRLATITGGRARISDLVDMPYLGLTPSGKNRLAIIIFDPGVTGGDFDITLVSKYNIRKDMEIQNPGRGLNEMEVRALMVDAIERSRIEQNGETFRFCRLNLDQNGLREIAITPEINAQQADAFLARWKASL